MLERAWLIAEKGGRLLQAARSSRVPLLPFVFLYLLLDLLFHGVEVERRRGLHWRVVDGCFGESDNILLNHDKAPELAREEVVCVRGSAVIPAFATKVRGPLEERR